MQITHNEADPEREIKPKKQGKNSNKDKRIILGLDRNREAAEP
jgi:hypothetical protein